MQKKNLFGHQDRHIDNFHSDIFKNGSEHNISDPLPRGDAAEPKKRGRKPRASLPDTWAGTGSHPLAAPKAKRGRKSKVELEEAASQTGPSTPALAGDSSGYSWAWDRRSIKRSSDQEAPDLEMLKPAQLRGARVNGWAGGYPAPAVSAVELEAENSGLQARNQELERRLIELTAENEKLGKGLLGLRAEMATRHQQAEAKEAELVNDKDHLHKMSKLLGAKNAEISALKLSEERLTLDNRKLTVRAKMTDLRGEKFEELKQIVKEVFNSDDEFSANVLVSKSNVDNDDDVFVTMKHVLRDYVATKTNHYADFLDCNKKLRSLEEDKASLQVSVATMVKKVRQQNEAFRNLNYRESDSKRLERDIFQYKKDIREITVSMKSKDELIRDLQADLMRTKLVKTESSGGQHLNSVEVKKYKQQIFALQEELKVKNRSLQNLQNNQSSSEMVKRLQKELEMREKDFLNSLKSYSSGLEALKSQVRKLSYSHHLSFLIQMRLRATFQATVQ